MNLATVNVIVCTDASEGEFRSLTAYPDTPKGNAEAEKQFKSMILGNLDADIANANMNVFLDDGFCEFGQGYVALVHSDGGKIP